MRPIAPGRVVVNTARRGRPARHFSSVVTAAARTDTVAECNIVPRIGELILAGPVEADVVRAKDVLVTIEGTSSGAGDVDGAALLPLSSSCVLPVVRATSFSAFCLSASSAWWTSVKNSDQLLTKVPEIT
jgi:hypothetical protein